MKVFLLIFGEFLLSGLLLYTRNTLCKLKLYSYVLDTTKNPIKEFISLKERIAYFITNAAFNALTFSFCPQSDEYELIRKEIRDSISKKEKMLLSIVLVGLYIRGLFGNVLLDIVFVITILFATGTISLPIIKESLDYWYSVFGHLFNSASFMEVTKWVKDYGIIILIIYIIILANVWILNRKKRKYSIEAIWAEKDAKITRKIAKIQKELEERMLQCRAGIYTNLKIIKREIQKLNSNNNSKADEGKSISFKGLIDYSETTNRIKELLHEIAVEKGITIFAQRNMNMYLQLSILDVLPSLSEKKSFIELEKIDKKYIEENCNDVTSLLESYAYGVAFVNGINRYLKFSLKKRKQYSKIALRISDNDIMKDTTEKLKG